MKIRQIVAFIILAHLSYTLVSCDNSSKNDNSTDEYEDEEVASTNEDEDFNEYLFYDDFEVNQLGWIEEITDLHSLVIDEGNYVMINRDSSTSRTSSYCIDKLWLADLPNEYTIETSINMVGGEADTLSCGLLLEGNTFEYTITVSNFGDVSLKEYNFQKDETWSYTKIENTTANQKYIIQVNKNEWDADIVINNELLGSIKLGSKSWHRISPFTGSLTHSKVDYLSIY